MLFGFIITDRCNAACAHCTSGCGPDKDTSLPTDHLVRLMNEAAQVWAKEAPPGDTLRFSFSGGEPFLDFPRLLSLFRHAASLGAGFSCVTNAYWASSDEKAREKLAQVKAAGLCTLAVSTSRFHQQFIKSSRVERALRIAKELGLSTVLKLPVTKSDQEGPASLGQWAKSCGADRREVFPVMPYLRPGATLPEEEYIRHAPLPRGRCPSASITIDERGGAYPCCMPGAFTEMLSLGDAHSDSFQTLYDRFYLRPEQQVLRHRGPAHLARAVIAAGEGRRLRAQYEGACDLCAHIASDPVMADIAHRSALEFANVQARRVSRALNTVVT